MLRAFVAWRLFRLTRRLVLAVALAGLGLALLHGHLDAPLHAVLSPSRLQAIRHDVQNAIEHALPRPSHR